MCLARLVGSPQLIGFLGRLFVDRLLPACSFLAQFFDPASIGRSEFGFSLAALPGGGGLADVYAVVTDHSERPTVVPVKHIPGVLFAWFVIPELGMVISIICLKTGAGKFNVLLQDKRLELCFKLGRHRRR